MRLTTAPKPNIRNAWNILFGAVWAISPAFIMPAWMLHHWEVSPTKPEVVSFIGWNGLLASFAVIIYGAAQIFRAEKRSLGFAYLLMGSILFTSCAVGMSRSLRVQSDFFGRMTRELDLLSEAAHRFETTHRKPPQSLTDLEMVGFNRSKLSRPAQELTAKVQVRAEPAEFLGNSWALYIPVPSPLSFDGLYYFPKQNYPRRAFGGVMTPMGKWAYLNE